MFIQILYLIISSFIFNLLYLIKFRRLKEFFITVRLEEISSEVKLTFVHVLFCNVCFKVFFLCNKELHLKNVRTGHSSSF